MLEQQEDISRHSVRIPASVVRSSASWRLGLALCGFPFGAAASFIPSVSFGKAYVWERDTGRLLRKWQAHQFRVSRLALSANGKVLLTRGASTALVWDLDGLLQTAGSR
jgi:hypothetical protein